MLYTPNDSSTGDFARDFARTLACPADPSKKAPGSGSFYSLFRPLIPNSGCEEQVACLQQPECWQYILDRPDALLRGYSSEVDPLSLASPRSHPVMLSLETQEKPTWLVLQPDLSWVSGTWHVLVSHQACALLIEERLACKLLGL